MSTFEETETVDITGVNETFTTASTEKAEVETADVTDDDEAAEGEKEADTENDAEEKPTEEEEKKLEIDVSELRYENVWKESNEKARTGAMDLWNDEFGDAMKEQQKKSRLDFLAVVCYHGEKLVAVSTLAIEASHTLWVKVGLFRCVVRSEYRRNGIATQLMIECKKALEKYSKEHPSEGLLALGATFQMKLLGDNGRKPVWPKSGMTLIGYNSEGMQVRLAWLDNARVQY